MLCLSGALSCIKLIRASDLITILRIVSRHARRFIDLIHTLRELHFAKERTTGHCVGLARIDPVDHPVDLFKIWRDEAKKFLVLGYTTDVCCVSTLSKDSKISSRNLVLRQFDNTGFVIITDGRSRKAKDMEYNPYSSICFLWTYKNDKQYNVSRQVRIEGTMEKLEKSAYQNLYDKEPLYCKIRSYLCDQNQPADWDDLNRRYNEILIQVQNGKDLSMPDHYVAYKLLPETIEFYYARDELIADRIHYKKDNLMEQWKYQRIAA